MVVYHPFWRKKVHWKKRYFKVYFTVGKRKLPCCCQSPRIYLSHTHLIHLHSEHDRQARDMIPTRKRLYSNKVLSYSHWSSEDTLTGINRNWAGSPGTSSSLLPDPANSEVGCLQFRCRRRKKYCPRLYLPEIPARHSRFRSVQLCEINSYCNRVQYAWGRLRNTTGLKQGVFLHVRRVLHVLELPKKEMQILLEYLSFTFGNLILTIYLEA